MFFNKVLTRISRTIPRSSLLLSSPQKHYSSILANQSNSLVYESPNKINGGIRAECISIKAGMEIPDKKRLEYALPYIHGIGRNRARQLLSELNMENKLAKDLTKREIVALGEQLSKYILGRELVGCVQRDIGRLVSIQCYKGIRHENRLPCRGQRTKTNARTTKSKPTPSLSRKW